ncbi:phosphotransferase enzyme family protein [Penicillium mononematosum]|uniref:phosphotransferase enzyme family protein n=1 Tax=Penicillium mononematosum TaxID=268346 RepID=UPI0025474ADA|nr:phosphotransferase enzyme family protein [Penicillium mononematosum]KAJ6189838.1 phosphotransferase enzyme family protein [Penicillium mononematosum]
MPTERDSTYHSFRSDWNSNDEFFKFTRGRFVVEEAENLDLNKLAQVTADSVGAAQCISIKKYPDGMFNKSFPMTIEDGQEVVAKVPNPNAGIPHFTTASEVATMDFARKIINSPAPHVYAWNSRAKSHPVGAEFIIMDKIEGVPLSEVWDTMQIQKRLKVILAMTSLQKEWLSVSFSHYESLYYAGDVQSPAGNHYVKRAPLSKIQSSPLARLLVGIGLMRADQFWTLKEDHYMQAVGAREIKAIQSLKPPKQIALFCGPKLYQPDAEKKLTVLAWYQKIVDALIPKDTSVTNPRLWHDDLHGDNIFADTIWLSTEERSAATRAHIVQNVFIGWRQLMHAKNLDLYRVVEFRKTPAYGLLFLAHRMFEYGEAHFLSLLVDLKDRWADLPGVTSDTPFPFDFSEEDFERIKLDSDDAVAGTELVAEIKEKIGDLWPDKGFIEYERYDDCKAVLDELKGQILDQLAETDEEKAEYQRHWPF